MMNFWTPTYSGWGDNFNDSDMPWYTEYDYVKVETYNQSTGKFEEHWQDKGALYGRRHDQREQPVVEEEPVDEPETPHMTYEQYRKWKHDRKVAKREQLGYK